MNDRIQRLQNETEAARAEVLALIAGLKPAQLELPTTNDGWSVKDTLAHLSSIEARVRLMLQRVLSGGVWTGDQIDLDAYNARCISERRTWKLDAIVAELEKTGAETAAALGRLTPDDLDREWTHPVQGRITIERTAGIIARHLRAHTEELRAALGT